MKILSKQFESFHQYQYILGIDPAISLDMINPIPGFSALKQNVFPPNARSSIGRNTVFGYILGSFYEIFGNSYENSYSMSYIGESPQFLKDIAKKNHKPIFFFQIVAESESWYVNLGLMPFDQILEFRGFKFIPLNNLVRPVYTYDRVGRKILDHVKPFNEIYNDLDFYNDCYNFLIECSQDKETTVEVDNKTKIQQQGFDLKTSFRKMKE